MIVLKRHKYALRGWEGCWWHTTYLKSNPPDAPKSSNKYSASRSKSRALSMLLKQSASADLLLGAFVYWGIATQAAGGLIGTAFGYRSKGCCNNFQLQLRRYYSQKEQNYYCMNTPSILQLKDIIVADAGQQDPKINLPTSVPIRSEHLPAVTGAGGINPAWCIVLLFFSPRDHGRQQLEN